MKEMKALKELLELINSMDKDDADGQTFHFISFFGDGSGSLQVQDEYAKIHCLLNFRPEDNILEKIKEYLRKSNEPISGS